MSEVQPTLVTKEGLEKLKKELEVLQTQTRAEVAQRLKEAIAMGDLSENSEYDDAKNQQSTIEGRIKELEQQIRTAQIIDGANKRKNRVDLGSTVTIMDLNKKTEQKVTIVGRTESDPFEGKISNESPVGRALVGAKTGNVVEAETPAGVLKYKIIKVES
ncbi:transcription elongation factor GreA [Veillonellaceae bacterium DNF00626]|jgi:hypothetical protein|nr:transcription elongation factor GreA [Veillonellaceae bacterium DNF00626]